MTSYQQFIFKQYEFNETTKKLTLHYGIDDKLSFTETYTFAFPFAESVDKQLLDIAFQTLFFMAGVSYYKTYIPSEIVVEAGQLDTQSADFFSNTYQQGLGEFYYVNKLDPRTPVSFKANTAGIAPPPLNDQLTGKLVAIGGGKDSLVSVELLRESGDVKTWSLNHRQQLAPLVEKIDLEHLWVEREWDKQLLELNERGALNGHVPISAILAAVGVVIAILTGSKDIVVSNESSASEPTLIYQGVAVNHQYSKSLAFEQAFQEYLLHRFNGSVRYYSLLRPYTELRIAELFAHSAFNRYKTVFSSCNRSYRHDRHEMSWCGECSKCAFVFLILTPFIHRDEVEAIWGGRNLLLDPSLEPTYRQLLGIEGDKPLDCVGEIKESRTAMKLAQRKYGELNKYSFDVPEEYDFRALSPHSLPADVLPAIQ